MKFSTLKHPLIWVSILLFLLNQANEIQNFYNLPLLSSYLDDLVSMPIVLGLGTQIIQWIHPVRDYYHLSITAIILTVLFYSILFELILPFYNPKVYTADIFDVLLYMTGAFLFYKLIAEKDAKRYQRLIEKLGD